VLGIVENLSAAYISAQYRGAFPMLLLVLVILFRPHGLFGRPEQRTV
jgi:branched-chain amino acid transport system permease protein